LIQESRYDLAAITLSGFRERLRNVIGDNTAGYDWYSFLFFTRGRRFQCNPFVVKPITSATISQQAPIFLRGCSQFIVEYAGDFVAQNAAGVATSAFITPGFAINPNGTDGQIDFILIDPTPGNPNSGDETRRIRWYGFPRNVDTGDDVGGTMIKGTGPASTMRDVVPLRDLLLTIPPPNGPVAVAPFEKFVTPSSFAPSANYYADAAFTSVAEYACAWGPNDPFRPKLIRITFSLDDPAARLAEAQTFEYVFQLP
jgi:hypothetical protein